MFRGEYQHIVDVKSRIIMPSKFRDKLGDMFIITKGLDKCLFVYTMDEWEAFEAKVKNLPMTDEGVRQFVRFFVGGACECEPDNQGRILLPANLKEYAAIGKNIVSVGVSNRIEIWAKESWDSYNDVSNHIDNVLASKMAQLGI